MQGIKALIGDLVATAESPLYSAMCWVEQQLGHRVGTRLLLRIVDSMVQDDYLRLWDVDASSGDRTELFSVPEDLADRYETLDHRDPSYDPFGLSLTLGARGESRPDPAWDVDVDLEQRVFTMRASQEGAADALIELRSLLPRVELEVTSRRNVDGESVLEGSARPTL